MTPCKACNDTYWVCEEHPNKSWEQGSGFCCGGAGMPCLLCNPCDDINPPKELAGMKIICDKDGSRH